MVIRGMRSLRGSGLVAGQLPFVLVMAIVVAAGVRIGMYHWREGAALIAGALFAAAVLRGVLTSNQSGLLAVRGRVVDVISYAVLGMVILAIAIVLGFDWVS